MANLMTMPWGDWMLETEERQRTYLLEMPAREFRRWGHKYEDTFRGDPRDAYRVLDRLDAQREAYAARKNEPSKCVKTYSDFNLWKDMVEEPEKYGDDIVEWLELNDKLTTDEGRWRIAAYWDEKEVVPDPVETPWREVFSSIAAEAARVCMIRTIKREIKMRADQYRAARAIQAVVRGYLVRCRTRVCEDCNGQLATLVFNDKVHLCDDCHTFWLDREEAWDLHVAEEEAAQWETENYAATVIQAAVRGHLARSKQLFRSCCICLSNRISPLHTAIGMMCRACAWDGVSCPNIHEPLDVQWARQTYADMANCKCVHCDDRRATRLFKDPSGIIHPLCVECDAEWEFDDGPDSP